MSTLTELSTALEAPDKRALVHLIAREGTEVTIRQVNGEVFRGTIVRVARDFLIIRHQGHVSARWRQSALALDAIAAITALEDDE